jgi:hypothetical protein
MSADTAAEYTASTTACPRTMNAPTSHRLAHLDKPFSWNVDVAGRLYA